jgi:hypothetical protein
LFSFYAPKKDGDKLIHHHLFFFSFFIPRGNGESMLVVIFVSFIFVHLEKTTMIGACHLFFFLVFLHPEKMMTS